MRSLIRLGGFSLAATVALGALPAPAEAAPVVYDARSLGMANSTVGYAGNASLAYWNPAAVANGRGFGLFLPSLAFSASNNILGVSQLTSLAGSVGSTGQPLQAFGSLLAPSGDASVVSRLGGADGLNIQARALVEPLGFSLAKVGPGSLAVRVYGGTTAMASLRLSPDFAQDVNGLVLQNGFQDIVNAASGLGQGAASGLGGDLTQLRSSVSALSAALEKNMGSFILSGDKKATRKEFSATTMTGTAGTVAATYAQPMPLPEALTKMLPEAQLMVGATGKVLQSGAGFLPAGLQSQSLAGGTTSGRFNPTAGTVKVSLDMDQEVTDLIGAVKAFDQEQNLATIGDLLGSVQNFLGNGIGGTNIEFSSLTPANNGVAADLGAQFRFNRWWSVGMTLVNPVLFWNAQRTTYRYRYDATSTTQPLLLEQVGGVENVAFRVAEPFSVRAGVAFTPQLKGKGAVGLLTRDILVTAGLDAPIITGVDLPNRPVVSLGFEKLFGPLALRLGTQQFGYAPFYTAGLGLQTRWFQFNVGGGADLPAVRGGAVSATMGVGF